MDNLTHSLTGWALGQAGLKTKSRKGLAGLILGANAPDIDVFFGWVPWEPLATHRGFTHSLVGGVIILPLMLGALLLLLDRWQVSRGTAFKSGLAIRPRWLLSLCYIGAITHPLLDLQTTYSVQLLSPFTGLWFHADSLFIIDLWLWLLLAGTIWWSKRREQRGDPGFRAPVQAALAAGFTYICLNIGLSDAAKAAVRAHDPAPFRGEAFGFDPPAEINSCFLRPPYQGPVQLGPPHSQPSRLWEQSFSHHLAVEIADPPEREPPRLDPDLPQPRHGVGHQSFAAGFVDRWTGAVEDGHGHPREARPDRGGEPRRPSSHDEEVRHPPPLLSQRNRA